MADIALLSGRDMGPGFAGRNEAIVTTAACPCDLGMIYRCTQPRCAGMARRTRVGGGQMVNRLAGGKRTIVTLAANALDLTVIDSEGTPRSG
jgi:hypothetical protein